MPRGGVLDVTAEGVAFEPHRGERLLGARGLWIPVREVVAVDAEPSRLRIVTTDQTVHLIRVGLADEVADHVRTVLSSQAIDDGERARLEQKLRRSSSRALRDILSGVAAVLLLWTLGPALIEGRGLRVSEILTAGVVVLMFLPVAAVRFRDRRRESGS